MKKPTSKKPCLRLLCLSLLMAGLNGSEVAQAQSYTLNDLWSVAPETETHPFIDTGHLTRGLAYNPTTSHVLVPSRAGGSAIHILSGTTGEVLGTLPFDDTLIGVGTFAVNMIAVTDDGVIYVGNLTTDAADAAKPFRLYRWANETAQPTLAYSGDPSSNDGVVNNRRFGDSIALRGTGAGTEILLGTLDKNAALLTTTDGTTFTAAKIITDGVVADTRWGLAWGAGETFWAKQASQGLKSFNLNRAAGTATVTRTVTGLTGGPLWVNVEKSLLAIIDATGHKLSLYDIYDPSTPVQQDTTRDFPAANANGNATGAASVRDGKLFALESNNGILAYSLTETIEPASIATGPSSATVWEGAETYTFNVVVGGTRPFTFQWRFNGEAIVGATKSSLTLTNISLTNAGAYSVVVSNTTGTATSGDATLTVNRGNPTDLAQNIWNILPGNRIYMTTGYKEYGLAINPLTTNVIIVTRQNPTSMVAVVDIQTGAHKHFIDTSSLGGVGLNKVDVADDGVIYACGISTDTALNPFTIYGISDDSPTPAMTGALYAGDPGNGTIPTDVVWGATLAVRGAGANTQILLGSGSWNKSSQTVAILRTDESGLFYTTPITVPDAPDKFSRLGVAWGPGTNTFWAKSTGNLILVEFDFATGTGTVLKNYSTSGSRSVPWSMTGICYDPTRKLLAGIQNGAPPTPVSVPIYDMSDLEGGPLWADQELFTTYNADIEYSGNVDFAVGYLVALGVNNGVKAFRLGTSAVSLPIIVTHPADATSYRGTVARFTVAADSTSPLSYQWYKDGVAITDATTTSLEFSNLQLSQAGEYMARVSNAGGYRDSLSATLTVLEPYTTAQMSNIWSLTAESRPYLNTGYFEYGMAFNPANSNLLVVSLANGVTVAVLDAITGADKHVLDVSPVFGGNKTLHKIDVADDGAVYAANLTTASASNPFIVYRWENDSPTTVPTVAFSGDPAPTAWPDKGCGYTLDVRGAGVNTEILVGSGAWNATSNIVSVLTTTDGVNFTPHEIVVAAAPSGFSRLGLCFGTGNTFWAKTWLGKLYLVEYNLAAGTGTILRTYESAQFPSSITSIDYNKTLAFLAGAANESQKNIQIYSVSDLAAGPQLRDQELFPTYNSSIEANGELDFGGNTYLFALNENNGIMAFLINTGYTPVVPSFKITSVSAKGGSVTLAWEAVAGSKYQVRYAESLTGTWQNLGSQITATGTTATYVDTAPGTGNRFYRVQSVQ